MITRFIWLHDMGKVSRDFEFYKFSSSNNKIYIAGFTLRIECHFLRCHLKHVKLTSPYGHLN